MVRNNNQKPPIGTIVLILCAILASVYLFSQYRVSGDSVPFFTLGQKKQKVIGELKKCGELVTTEIKLKRVINVSRTVSGNWEINPFSESNGTAHAIVPIEVRIQYGFDLSKIKMDNVKISDDESEVMVYLPEPEIIHSTFNNNIDRKNIELIIPDGMDTVSTADIDQQLVQAYDSIIQDFPHHNYSERVVENTKAVFELLLKKLDYQSVIVEVGDINLKK